MKRISKELNEIIDLKEKLRIAGCEELLDKVVYVSEVPMIGINKSYIIEEIYGVKVARVIGIQED